MKKINLRESKALKELHDIRRKIQRKAESVGWENYLVDLNKRPSLFKPRRSRNVTSVRERPAKYKTR